MGIVAHTGRYLRSAAYLKPSQIAWRLYYTLRRRLGWTPRPPAPAAPPRFNQECLDRLEACARCWAASAPPPEHSLAALRAGRFEFLQFPVDGSDGPPWHKTGLPRLWRYHLHYFDYLRAWALGALRMPELDGDVARAWIADWIAHNPPGTDVAWDAFPTAARLMNWALAEAVFRWDDDSVRGSFAQQAEALRRSMEHDVRANHLLQNAAGLAVAGSLLDAPFLEDALALLERETREQVLADGGHYERSVMYHCHAMAWLVLVRAALAHPPDWLGAAIARMDAFLAGICHPDGGIPLFGDAARDDALPPRALHQFTGVPRQRPEGLPRSFPESGYYVLGSSEATRLTAKAGPPGPAYQLGHAHADALSYECSVGGRLVLVDSGVHGYAESPLRAYCRATRAHNTVSVNSGEQLEAWGVFRVGRRYSATVHAWGRHTRGYVLRASHDGFRPCLHRRAIHALDDGYWVVIDHVSGPGVLDAESYVHLHPDFAMTAETGTWRAGPVSIAPFGHAAAMCVRGVESPKQGWYCPAFGVSMPSDTLILQTSGSSQLRFGYAIVPAGAPDPAPADLPALANELEALDTLEPIDAEH